MTPATKGTACEVPVRRLGEREGEKMRWNMRPRGNMRRDDRRRVGECRVPIRAGRAACWQGRLGVCRHVANPADQCMSNCAPALLRIA